MMLDPYKHRLLVVIWAIVETSLFGGIMHGWASLVYMVKEDGLYSDLCSSQSVNFHLNNTNTSFFSLLHNVTENVVAPYSPVDVTNNTQTVPRYNATHSSFSENTKCKAQDSMIALGQTISSSTSFLGILTVGQLHRKLGTKKLRILLWMFFVTACLFVAFVNNDTPWLIFLAYWLAGVAGLGLLTTNIQVSFLYTSASSTVVSLICGGYDFSGSMMLFIKFAYEAGVSLRTSHLVLAGCSVMTAISAICWLPWKIFQKQETKATKRHNTDDTEALDKDSSTNNDTRKPLTPDSAHTCSTHITPPLRTFLTSPLFLLHIMWYIILQIRFINIVAFLNPFLVYITHNNTQIVSHYTNVFLYSNMFGYVTSFIAGLVYDWQKARFKDSTPRRRSILPAALPFSLASLLGVLVSVLILVPHIQVLYAVFVLTTAFRSFLYSMAASFLSEVFPAEHFSALYTIMVISGGVISSVQYALYHWSYAYDGAFTHVCITLAVFVVLSFIHPGYIVYTCRRESSVPVSHTESEAVPLSQTRRI